MRLCNKNTGEICDFIVKVNATDEVIIYETIDSMLEEWEIYKPAEPLIKDKKIRKAVRAWAEANDIERVWHEYSSCWLRGNGLKIEIENEVVDLKQKNYTIDELCGEEG